MSDVFISYARSTEGEASRITEALRAVGYRVWRDDELPAHRDYSEVLEERLRSARAVVVLWSAEAVKSQWVRAEADVARQAGTLVQLTLDGAMPPLPFNRIQCADLAAWDGDESAPGWRKVLASIADLLGEPAPAGPQKAPHPPATPPLPEKPSIAVLPFTDLSPAKDQDYFCDGMVVEIVTALSRFPSLFVIASTSSLSYRGDPRGAAPIAAELGVRYLLQGSVRQAGQRVRISVELVDATAGHPIWAERFDGTLEDVFALQDTVSNAVASQIAPTIETAEIRRASARPTQDLGAYDLYLRGLQRFHQFTKASLEQARDLLDQAIARDPNYAIALALAVTCRANLIMLAWSDRPDEDLRIALEHRARALQLTGADPEVLAYVGHAGKMLGLDSATAEALTDRALALNPGSAPAWMCSGWVHAYSGQAATALEQFDTALRLDPRTPWRPLVLDGMVLALFSLRRFDEAIPLMRQVLDVIPELEPTYLEFMAATFALAGRLHEARDLLASAPADPGFENWLETLAERDRALVIEGLALARGGG